MKTMLNPAPPEPLAKDECLRLLELRQVGRFAFVLGRRPEILPMAYRLFQGSLIVRTTCGIDLDAAHGQPVAFEVGDTDEGGHSGWSVVVHGQAERIWRSEELRAVGGLPSQLWASGYHEHCFRILPAAITGRRIGHDHGIDLAGMPDTWHG